MTKQFPIRFWCAFLFVCYSAVVIVLPCSWFSKLTIKMQFVRILIEHVVWTGPNSTSSCLVLNLKLKFHILYTTPVAQLHSVISRRKIQKLLPLKLMRSKLNNQFGKFWRFKVMNVLQRNNMIKYVTLMFAKWAAWLKTSFFCQFTVDQQLKICNFKCHQRIFKIPVWSISRARMPAHFWAPYYEFIALIIRNGN